MNSKIRKLLLIILLSIISLIIPNSVKADESSIDKSQVEVKYTIKIKKIDTETKELLKGAVFELKDTEGNVVRTASTDENGDLSFGEIKTLGSGIDTYYIKENTTPEGYAITEKEDIEVKVIKNVSDDGKYTLRIECQTLNYSFDITIYDYIPVATVEQLKKIGSGEEIEYEGVKYTYSENANYKLVDDIDLKGIDWTPIDKKISGIFDGNGHSIKNLTIAKKENGKFEYSEIGLFRYFSGVVQNLDLKDVNIVATNIDIDTTTGIPKESISGKIGVGAFAGYMEKGIVKNCTVSGTIVSYYNNVGGFVGHSKEENIIKFQDCTSSVTLTSAKVSNGKDVYNAGGMIGCAVGSVSFEDCTFNGNVQGNGNNVGGLVGFTNSDGYEEYGVKAGYVESNNEITLLIGNSRIKGKYDLILQNYDINNLGLITGAKYSIFNSNFEKIKGFENIQLQNGELKIEDIEIKIVGTDVFYIKELEPAPGYQKLNSYIKLVITRYWDTDTNSFKVKVEFENICDSKFDEEKNGSFDGKLESLTGKKFPDGVNFENVGWNNAKALFINSNNKGSVQGNRDVGGLLGTSYCKVEMSGCKNYGQVVASGSGKAAGLICKIEKQDEMFLVKIENCYNEGNIVSNSSGTDCASGILGQVIANIEIENCMNNGEITLTHNGGVSGILADFKGNAEISNCVNKGDLLISSGDPYGVNGVVGGILAKNYISSYEENITKDQNNISIYNCTNTGNIKSDTHCGGIIGYSNGNTVKINNCINQNNSINAGASDKGGMMGFASVKYLEIKKCVSEKTEFSQTGDSTYGLTGGILGDMCYSSGGNSTYGKTLIISDCNVVDCSIKSIDKETGGIFGGGNIGNTTENVFISNCNVEGCTIENSKITGTYGGSGGIIGATYSGGNIIISNCNVKKSDISCLMANGCGGSDTNTGGIVGICAYNSSMSLTNNIVEDCTIYNQAPNDTCGNTGGIIAGYNRSYSGTSDTLIIDNCDVKNTNFNNFSGNLAGTVAYTNDTKVIISNCDNENINLDSKSRTSSDSNTAGIIAYNSKDIEIENCNVIGDEENKNRIDGIGRNVAGIVGHCGSNVTIKKISVKNFDIHSEGANNYSYGSGSSNDMVSGVIGYTQGTPRVEDCLIENCNIGGIVGNAIGVLGATSSSYQTNFKNITVKNTNISNEMFCARSYGNSTAAGLIGYIYGDSNVYQDIIIDGCNITGLGGATSGMIACSYGGNFDNCIVKNTNVTKEDDPYPHITYTSVAGMIASASSNKISMVNCKIEKVKIVGDCYSQGGFIGSVGEITEFKDNTINDLTIIGTKGQNNSNYSNGSIGGMIGDFTNTKTFEIENCDVTDFIAESEYHNIGGMIGTTNSNLTLDECDLIDLDLKYTNESSINGYSRCVGGMVAISSGKLEITNGTVKGSQFTATTGTNNTSSVGSLIGYAKNNNNDINVIINECEISGNTILNETLWGMAGGIIGADYCMNSGKELHNIAKISNVNVSDCEITALAGAGGAMGYGVGNIEKVDVKKCEIQNQSTSNGVGGIIGVALSKEDSSITNSTVKDSSITSKSYAGGIVGYTSGKIDGCTVTNTPITSDSSSNCVGGIAGFTYGENSSIENSNVNNCNISNTNLGSYHVGGIVGLTEGNISDCKVIGNKNSITSNSTTGAIGGIVGLVPKSTSSIKNSDVSNYEIVNNYVNGESSSGYFVGGIAGFSCGDLINNIVNEGTTVSLKGKNKQNSLGGIIGMTSISNGNVTDCSVDGIKVIGTNGYIGGIVGESNNTITGCDVNNSTIEAEDGSEVFGCGGIIGCGSDGTTVTIGILTKLKECSIENSTVKAHDHVGAVSGIGIVEECCDCEVDNVTVIEDGEEKVYPIETQVSEQELESEEIINDDLSSESNTEIEATKEEKTSNTTDSVEENLNLEVDEPKDEMNQDTTEDSNTNDENKDDTQEGQDCNLESKEDETTSDEEAEPNSPDMVEPNQEEDTEDESEKSEAGENPKSESSSEQDSEPKTESEENNTTESTEDIQMPEECTEQNLQQENETSGEQ